MSDGGRPSPNEVAASDPYRAPSYFEQPSVTAELDARQRTHASRWLRMYRGGCTALGILLCLIGTLFVVVTAFLITYLATAPGLSWAMYAAGGALTAFSIGIVGVYSALAIGALRRRAWAAWGALAVDSMFLVTACSYSEFNAVSFVTSFIVILTASAVLYFERRAKAADIALQMSPGT